MIKNTSKTQRQEWVLGVNPGAIEAQEARGQQQLAKSSQLPTEGLTPEMCEKHGITIQGLTDGDPLFTQVALPDGWKVAPTDHSMWSNLLNDKGEKVASIFYKAAYYDRRAFIGFNG